MFLQVPVCPQWGVGIPGCIAGHMTRQYISRCTPPDGEPPPGMENPLDGDPPQMEKTPPGLRPPGMENPPSVNVRAVRILLECILVGSKFWQMDLYSPWGWCCNEMCGTSVLWQWKKTHWVRRVFTESFSGLPDSALLLTSGRSESLKSLVHTEWTVKAISSENGYNNLSFQGNRSFLV